MKTSSLALPARTFPQPDPNHVGVNVTLTHREAKPDSGLEFTRDEATVAHIRQHLPNAPSLNLQTARHARVLDQEAAFLTDDNGKVPPPDKDDLISALRFAAEFMRDRIVIG